MTFDYTSILVTALTQLPATIAALAAWRVGRKNGRKAAIIVEKADILDKKVDLVKETTETSAHNVNGNLTGIKNELSIAVGHNIALQETIKTLTTILNSRRDNTASEFNEHLLRRDSDKK